MNRWTYEEVAPVLSRQLPQGIEDLWNAVPEGTVMDRPSLRGLLNQNQAAIVQNLALIEQQVIATAGVSVGYRPELFNLVKDLPGVDVLAEVASLIFAEDLDIGEMTAAAQNLLAQILKMSGQKTGAAAITGDYGGAILAVVQVVWQVVETIVQHENAWKEYQRGVVQAVNECKPVAFGAALDSNEVLDGLRVLAKPNWERLFLPQVRPDFGFTCCPTTTDRGRMIAPVGIGVGNGRQDYIEGPYYGDGPGFGCLPMCPDLLVHRALIVRGSHLGIYEAAGALPLTAGFGIRAERLLWNGGPATYAVDGRKIAHAWMAYFGLMRTQIGRNMPGVGSGAEAKPSDWGTKPKSGGGPGICDDWPQGSRISALAWLFERIGCADARASDPDGIYSFEQSAPARRWRLFEIRQLAMLGYDELGEKVGPPRLVAGYVNAKTCHPAWRKRVGQAHRELLELGDAVCLMDLDSIADPDYLAAVKDRRRQKGAVCYAVAGRDVTNERVSPTEGPSLRPLGEGAPPIPSMPIPATPTRADDDDSSLAPWLLGAGALGLGLLLRRRLNR